MPQVKIEDIVIGDRFRKNFDHVPALAASIAAHGLINPIVVDENNFLIAGESRLRAHQLLKRDSIEVIYKHDLSELQRKELELEENIQRKDFTWSEEVSAKAQLHALKQKLHGAAIKGHATDSGAWKVKDTAEALGESTGTISMDLQLARGLKAFPELLKEKSKTVAYKKLKMKQESILQEELAKRMTSAGVISSPEVTHGNCLDDMNSMEANSVDLILTDPPFGIDIGDSHTFGRMTPSKTYDDGEHEAFDLMDKMFQQFARILKDERHMFVFCAIDKHQRVKEMLEKYGFGVWHLPIIWDKGSGSYPSQGTSFVHSYECFLHAWKGNKRILNGTPRDVFSIKRVPKKIHPSEKPTELLRELINLTTLAGELVYDPCAGSGSTLVSAKELMRRAKGCELDVTYYTNICKRLGGEDVAATGDDMQ